MDINLCMLGTAYISVRSWHSRSSDTSNGLHAPWSLVGVTAGVSTHEHAEDEKQQRWGDMSGQAPHRGQTSVVLLWHSPRAGSEHIAPWRLPKRYASGWVRDL